MGELTETGAQVAGSARQEADAYRGDNDRPLGGYLAVMGVYGVVVTVAALAALVTGRRLPPRWRVQDLLLLTLGNPQAVAHPDQGRGNQPAARTLYALQGHGRTRGSSGRGP